MFDILNVEKESRNYKLFEECFNVHSKFLKLNENFIGKDYIIGDIHGQFNKVMKVLGQLKFNPSTDRLICVGDLIDRGSQNHHLNNWMNYDWFYSVMGNHDLVRILMYFFQEDYPEHFEFVYKETFIDWYDRFNNQEKFKFIKLLLQLPLAIEVSSKSRKYGIIHGDFPEDYSCWEKFKIDLLENKMSFDNIQKVLFSHTTGIRANPMKQHKNLYGNKKQVKNIKNIDNIIIGHTPQKKPAFLDQFLMIDTGGGFTLPNELKPSFCLKDGYFSIYSITDQRMYSFD